MVEATSSQAILVGNPTSVRGHRTSLAVWKNFKIYSVTSNLIIATDTIQGNHVFTECPDAISAISVYPISENRARVAFGTEKGRVFILRLSEDGSLETDKDHQIMGGAINALIWTPDGKALIALGLGSAAINPENGHGVGDILGHAGKILCGVLNSSKTLFSAGEGLEILRHEGPPFKGQGKPIKNIHTGFVN